MFRTLWNKIRSLFSSGVAPEPSKPDPIEVRNTSIENFYKLLETNIIDNINVLRYEDDNFYNYLSFIAGIGSSSGIGLGKFESPNSEVWEDLTDFCKEQSRKQAEFFWTLNHVIPVQLVNPIKGEKYTRLKYYYMKYKENLTEPRRLSLEVLSDEVGARFKTLPFISVFNFFDVPAVGMADLGVKMANEHYVGDVISALLHSCDGEATFAGSQKDLPTMNKINILSDRIAMVTRRGAGNFALIDSKDVNNLRYAISKQHPGLITEEEAFNGIHQDSLIKYEFTLNKRIRVFSSDIFDKVVHQAGKDVNMIMGYSGTSNIDSGNFLVVSDYFRWISIPFQFREVRDVFESKYGTNQPPSKGELEKFRNAEFDKITEFAKVNNSYAAEITYGIGLTKKDADHFPNKSDYYRAVKMNFDE